MEKEARDNIQQAENLKDAVDDAQQKSNAIFAKLEDIIDKYKEFNVEAAVDKKDTKYSAITDVNQRKEEIIQYAKGYVASEKVSICKNAGADQSTCAADNSDLKTQMQNLAVDYDTAKKTVASRTAQLTNFKSSAFKDTLCDGGKTDCGITIPDFSGVEQYCVGKYPAAPPAATSVATSAPTSEATPAATSVATSATTSKEILTAYSSATKATLLKFKEVDKLPGICLAQAASILADKDMVTAQTVLESKKVILEKQQQVMFTIIALVEMIILNIYIYV